MKTREVKRILKGRVTWDGAGVKLIRVLGRDDLRDVDPFLMLDAFGSDDPEDYLKGFPMHPHRGIETITYLLEGRVDHVDSLGNGGTLLAGDRYNRGRLWIINQFDTRYGINYIAKTTYKNEDELKYAFMALWKFSRTWAYSFTVNFRTQYSKGYLSPTDHTLISNFMAPGYIDVALGATYKKDGFPITFTISPIATSTMTVLDRTLSWQGLNGITPGHKARTLIGSSFKADYDQSFFDKTLRCRSSLYSFCDYKKAPNVRWENTITYGLGKYITASLYWLLFYDPYGTPPMLPKKLQSTYAAGLGLAYNFKNK